MSKFFGFVLLFATVLFSGSVILSSAFIARGYEKSKADNYQDVVTVNGRAEQTIESDMAKWSLRLSRSNASSSAEILLRKDGEALQKLVKLNHIDDADFSFHPIKNSSYDYGDGYYSNSNSNYAEQIVVIESKKVIALAALADTAREVLKNDRGADLKTTSIEFFSDDVDELKNELAKKAVLNAHKQAQALVGSRLGTLRTLGQVQYMMTPLHTANDSYYQKEDTSSIKKKISASITATYRLK